MNKHTAFIIGAIITSTTMTGVASAQEVPTPTLINEVNEVRKEHRGQARDIRESRQELRESIRDDRMGFKEARDAQIEKIKSFGTDTKEAMRLEHESIKARLEVATTDEEREAIRAEARERRIDLRDEAREGYAGLKQERKNLHSNARAQAKKRFTERINHVHTRLDHALSRFDALSKRLETYLDRKSQTGVDSTAAQSALSDANNAHNTAKDMVALVKSLAATVNTSDTPKEDINILRTAIKEATQAIRIANTAMRDAINAARAMK